jgi:hypothetical protein
LQDASVENCLWVNLALQHAFVVCVCTPGCIREALGPTRHAGHLQALRDTRKMRERFEAYLDRKAGELARRMGSSITVRSYDLGVAAPYITDATVLESVMDKPNRLTVKCRLTYTGGVALKLDVALPLGIPATVDVSLASVKGVGRLQLAGGRGDAMDPVERDAHWSFSFYGEPELDVRVDSTLRGKSVTRMTSLIQTFIRNAFRRRHVLPAYRARYLLKDRLVVQPLEPPAAAPAPNEALSFRANVGVLAVRGMLRPWACGHAGMRPPDWVRCIILTVRSCKGIGVNCPKPKSVIWGKWSDWDVLRLVGKLLE